MTNPTWDVIVIGSGAGGLITASQLAAKGAQVLVLERYLVPGGSAASFHRKGYTFDVGASMIFGFGSKGHTNLLTRALADVGQHVETIPDPVQLEYHLPDNFRIAVSRDYRKFLDDLNVYFPHEKDNIQAFYGACWQVFRCLDAIPLLSLEDPAYLAKVFLRAPGACLSLARWLPFNVGDVARRYIRDPQLLKFIDIECFCWSVMPADRTPMINAGMVFSDRHAGGINYPRGGVGVIAAKLVKGLQSCGGKIRYKAHVKTVLLEEGRAVGVRLANGEELRAKRIVSNATRWDTFGRGEQGKDHALVDRAKTPASEVRWRRRYKPSPSFLSLHLGVDESIVPQNFHCHHLLLEDWKAMEDEQGVIFLSIPTLLDQSLAPPGHHIIHTFTQSSMENWRALSSEEYRMKKERDANRLIHRLEVIIPGITAAVRHNEIATPRSHRRFLGRLDGSYGPVPAQRLPGLLPMPFNRTGIPGLYLVGDSCFPGQGLNAVAFSAYACSHRIGADLGLNPWSLPD
ncbi:carotene isomerase [cyanobiont of Ornithocercus magnificus]|nr:carotene isomerase [cyanobiont of Ornithocercus magnificus]